MNFNLCKNKSEKSFRVQIWTTIVPHTDRKGTQSQGHRKDILNTVDPNAGTPNQNPTFGFMVPAEMELFNIKH